MKSHSPATPCRSGEYGDVAARTLGVRSGLQRTAVTVLVVAGLAVIGAPAWAKDKPIVADDVQCDGCVGTTDVEDGSLTKSDLSFEPQERVTTSCAEGSSIREIHADGTVVCETDDDTDTDTDTLSDLAADPQACPDGSFLRLDPAGSGQWQCLSLFEMKLSLGLVQTKYVFVTADTYDGNLGGVAGADAKCNQSAADAGLPGDYFAWVGTSSYDPYNLVDASAVYTLVDGRLLFQKADFETCDFNVDCLAHPINLDASGAEPSGEWRVWTGCGTGDTSHGVNNEPSTFNCRNWSSATEGYSNGVGATVGTTNTTDARWTYSDVQGCADLQENPYKFRLYCMER
jgi:hypothetical protein